MNLQTAKTSALRLARQELAEQIEDLPSYLDAHRRRLRRRAAAVEGEIRRRQARAANRARLRRESQN